MIIFFVFLYFVVFLLWAVGTGPATHGAPLMFSMFIFRHFLPSEWLYSDEYVNLRYYMKGVGAFFTYLFFIYSKVYMMYLMFFCRLIRRYSFFVIIL